MATQQITAQDHKLLVAGEWIETGEWIEVANPYDQRTVGRVPRADGELAERAIATAHETFLRGGLPAHERASILDRAAHLAAEREDELAVTLAAEAGKPLVSARVEAQRCVDTLTFSAVEARKLAGHMVPMEASSAGEGKVGMALRVPLGVVGAISPFNFPLNLVAHKLGPGLAAGNAIVLKPASSTPLSAIKLCELLLDAGLPAGWLSVVCGSGSEIGERFTGDDRVKGITFTGSSGVGWGIRADAPTKKVNLELGSTAPLIVHEDGDWQRAADDARLKAYSHAGQSCISIQRILVHRSIADRFTQRFVENAESLRVGDPLDEDVEVGPLIDRGERDRVKQWIDDARQAGTEVLTGGELVDDDRCLAPTVLDDPDHSLKVWCEEIFGPVVTISPFDLFEQGLAMANDAHYGLNAGVYTSSVGNALEAARVLEYGSVLVNEVPTFRTDQMPYGGVKDSGNTREGPAYAVAELTETRFVSLQG